MWPFASETSRARRKAERDLREAEDRARTYDATMRTNKLKLKEAVAFDWVTPYLDLLQRSRPNSWDMYGPFNRDSRRGGGNFPLFRTEQELALIRAPSRILCATNDYAIALQEGLASYIFGPSGFDYECTSRREDEFPGLAEAVQKQIVDPFLRLNGWHGAEQTGLEEECFFTSIEDGEFILAHYRNDDGTYEVRTVASEYLTQKPGADSREWGFGIRTEPGGDEQTPLGYWLHFGDTNTVDDGEEFAPDRVTHFKRRSKRSIKRGMPEFSFSALEAAELANTLLCNLGDGGAQQAAIVGVREHAVGTKAEIQSFADNQADYTEIAYHPTGRTEGVDRKRRGRWEDVGKNLKYAPGPGAVNAPAHLLILQALIRSFCARWNAPEFLGSADASNSNLNSATLAVGLFAARTKREQFRYSTVFVGLIWRAVEWWFKVHKTIGVKMPGGVVKEYDFAAVKALVDIVAGTPEPPGASDLEKAQVRQIECQNKALSPQTWRKLAGYDNDTEENNINAFEDAHGVGSSDPLGVGGIFGAPPKTETPGG